MAGPVIAAAVILPWKYKVESYRVFKSSGITDSKLLTVDRREKLDKIIRQHCLGWGIGAVGEQVIDKINVHHASLLAMRRAVEQLRKNVSCESKKTLLCLDGKFILPDYDIIQEAIINGDAKILSIAAASIVAKVYRDNLMKKLHAQYPEYNFAQHKGYATFHHRQVIKKVGLSPIHRLSFCKGYI